MSTSRAHGKGRCDADRLLTRCRAPRISSRVMRTPFPLTRLMLLGILAVTAPAAAETVTLATYNIEHFQDNFRAHELSKKLPRDISDPVLKDLLASEREGDDEDNWEVAQVITHPEFNPDVLVIQEGC